MQPDPYYQSSPAQWIASATASVSGLEVIVDDDLPAHLACQIDHDARLVHLAPGLSLDDYQWALTRAVLRDRWGAKFAPEFDAPARRLRSVSRGAIRPMVPSGDTCPACGHWYPVGQAHLS